jgi:hypothetical protein
MPYWLRVDKVCSSELDPEQIEYTGMYLEDTTLSWFEDNVDGIDDTQPRNPNKTPKMPLFSITRVRGRL